MPFRLRNHAGEPLIAERLRRNRIIPAGISVFGQVIEVKEIIPVAEGQVIESIADFFVLCHSVLKDRIEIIICQNDTHAVDGAGRCKLQLPDPASFRKIGLPYLVPVCQGRLVVVVIDIKLYAEAVKSSGVLHDILHAVHDDMCPHRYEGVEGIYGNGVV